MQRGLLPEILPCLPLMHAFMSSWESLLLSPSLAEDLHLITVWSAQEAALCSLQCGGYSVKSPEHTKSAHSWGWNLDV
jgi:hypothetical protein